MIIRIWVRFTHVYIFQRNNKCSFPMKIVDNIHFSSLHIKYIELT